MVMRARSRLLAFWGVVPQQYLLPLLLLLGSCFGSIAVMLFVTTASQDRMEAVRERHTMQRALENAAQLVEHDLQDYAKWDEAVRHIARDFEPEWIDDNVTAYLGKTQGYSHVFVIDPRDRTAYAFSYGKLARTDAIAELGAAFGADVARVRRMDPAGAPVLRGFARKGHRLFIYSVAAVVPLTGKVTLPPGGKYVLAIVAEADAVFLERMRRQHHLRPFQLLWMSSPAIGDDVEIRDNAGEFLTRVDLNARHPGAVLRNQILPGLVFVAALGLLAAGRILHNGSRTIKDLRDSREQALHHANHDSLTGLPNRRWILDAIRQAMVRRQRICLLFMDLDGFKEVNDLFGHAMGDKLLQLGADRIRSAAGPGALVARAGGDEFAVLLPDAEDREAGEIAAAIVAAFERPIAMAGTNIGTSVSIGLATFDPAEVLDDDELVRRADVAMYTAKNSGRNRWHAYDAGMDDTHDLRKRLEADLRGAIEQGEIDVAFQPIVDAKSERTVCLEALARWTHRIEGVVPPDVFIPLAEMNGMIGKLGRQVLAKACAAVRDLDIALSVNLSPAQFWDRSLVDEVRRILDVTGFPPRRLQLEITEGYLIRRPDAAARIIDELRRLGIRIALDDFGTGFASIGYLRQLNLDSLKIDREFVATAATDARAAGVLASIVALGRALDLEITAEGVETEAQAELVRATGCDRMQGWLFGKAGELSELGLDNGLGERILA